MVCFLYLTPNKGANIGHQATEHFILVTYCRIYNMKFIYHPFIGASEDFEKLLHFNEIPEYKYNNLTNYRIYDVSEILDDLHNNLLKLNANSDQNLVIGNIHDYPKIMDVMSDYSLTSQSEVTHTKKMYRCLLEKKFVIKDKYNHKYICINIENTNTLGVDYFVEQYYKLLEIFNFTIDIHVLVLAPNNLILNKTLLQNIKNVEIIDCNDIDKFYIMVNSTYLITSPSSFANLAYILGNMPVIVAPNDWNVYWDNIIITTKLNYLNTYHFLNPHLHTDTIQPLYNLTDIYQVKRHSIHICRYENKIKENLKKNCLFSDEIFNDHIVSYPKHKIVSHKKNKCGISIIDCNTSWSNAYFHFLTESLPCILECSNYNVDYPILCNKTGFTESIIRYFGVSNSIIYDTPDNVAEVVKQHYIECGNMSPEKVQIIRNKLQSNIVFEKKIGIFIFRKENYRNIINHAEVLEMLKIKYNDIEWVVFDSLSFEETVTLFSKAKIIVGPHGAGLTNMLFSPNEITIVEFMIIDNPNVCYWHMSEMLDNNYYMIPCITSNQNFIVDMHEVEKLLPSI